MLPRLFGEPSDKDTQFIAGLKKHQDFVFIGGIFVVIILAVVIFSSFSSTPKGTWRFGLCKVFLEQYAQYPTNIRILTTGEKQSSAQIGYLLTNSYGARESELMECFYNTGRGGVTLNRVTIDRKQISGDLIKTFNPTIPIIMARKDLDVDLPKRLPNNLIGLKFE